MWGVSLTRPVLFYVRSFSYTFLAFVAIDKNKTKKMHEHGQSGEVCVPRLRSSQCRDHMATLPWFWPDAQHVGDCGHRLLRRHFTMDRHSWSGIASVQTAGRQRLRADVTRVPTAAVLTSFLFFSCHLRSFLSIPASYLGQMDSFSWQRSCCDNSVRTMMLLKTMIVTFIIFDRVLF